MESTSAQASMEYPLVTIIKQDIEFGDKYQRCVDFLKSGQQPYFYDDEGNIRYHCDEEGSTVLALAAGLESPKVYQLLIEHLDCHDIDIKLKLKLINIKDKNEYTALMWACAFDNVEIAESLIRRGAHINIQHDAPQASACDDTKKSEYKELQPIHVAAGYGHLKTVELLIGCGAEINKKDGEGWTAIHYAVSNNHVSVVKLLIEATADCDVKNNRGETPLMQAAYIGNEEIVKLLLPNVTDVDMSDGVSEGAAIHWASQGRHTVIMEALIEAGADINKLPNEGGGPPLLWALVEDENKVENNAVTFLLGKKADTNLVDAFGNSPLHIASRSGNIYSVCGILEKNPNINLPNIYGRTPLMNGVHGGHIKIVLKLLESGADPELKDKHGVTALMLAGQLSTEISEPIMKALEQAISDRAKALHVDATTFIKCIDSGEPLSYVNQWFPLLSSEKQTEIIKWALEKKNDEYACYAALFHGDDENSLLHKMSWADTVREEIMLCLVYSSKQARHHINGIVYYSHNEDECSQEAKRPNIGKDTDE